MANLSALIKAIKEGGLQDAVKLYRKNENGKWEEVKIE